MTTQNVPVARRIANISEHGTGVVQLVRAVWLHRTLSIELARRELTDLHAGHIGGFLWIVVHPFLMLMVYSFLFTIVLKVRIANGGPADYTIYLFAGLAPWLFTQDVLTRSAYVMLSNIGIVKKVMFPTEALVAKTMLASVMAQSVLMVLVLLATMIVRGGIPPSFGLLLLLAPLHLVMLWGLGLLLSAITPYFRDTTEFLRIFLMVNIFVIPVMYVPSAVPGPLRFIVDLNPFSHLILCYQDAIYYGAVTHPVSWFVTAAFSVLCLTAGSYVFLRLRHHFGSIL